MRILYKRPFQPSRSRALHIIIMVEGLFIPYLNLSHFPGEDTPIAALWRRRVFIRHFSFSAHIHLPIFNSLGIAETMQVNFLVQGKKS